MTPPTAIPSLEERFLEPAGWRWHSFKNKSGQKIRFGSVYPESRIPDAVVVILPGRAEFIEKYFETAHDMAVKNLAVWIIDWQGQGLSARMAGIKDDRGHCPDFETYVEDLHEFILGYVKHACVHPDVGRIPMVMLGQSMGGNIGLRFLQKYPGMFECAALTSPMLGIKTLVNMPSWLPPVMVPFMGRLFCRMLAYGQKGWNKQDHLSLGVELTSDPVRGAVHDTWMEGQPDLRVGGVTYGWIYEAYKSCRLIMTEDKLKSVQTRVVFTLGGRENLVDNAAIRRAVAFMPNAALLEFPEGGHEVLMEKDEIRNAFLERFYGMIRESIIERPETLKPF